MRADLYLFKNGFCESRNKAARCIEAGLLTVNGITVKKCSYDISENDKAELAGEAMPYVSRGGLKLEWALSFFESLGVSPEGRICVDIGASTGGFTDCLLKNGAEKVYCVDCGSGQLHKSLLGDKRVVSIENFNARNLSAEVLGEKCDMAVMDVSFISQCLLHSAVKNTIKDGAVFISLIKPQFEAGRSSLDRHGVVKSPAAHMKAVKDTVENAERCGFGLEGLTVSPISGGSGNREYLACFKSGRTSAVALTRKFLEDLTLANK